MGISKHIKQIIIIIYSFSIFCGLLLLFTDVELWDVGISHAYVLIIFIIIELGILTKIVINPKNLNQICIIWGLIKVILLFGDILTAKNFGLTYYEFAVYLFNIWLFNGLIISQVMVILLIIIEKHARK
jgi:hypothetical protein